MKRSLVAVLFLLGLGLVAAQPPSRRPGSARGRVFDDKGQPVVDAKVLIEYQGGITRKFETKTNKKGEFMQVGMQPGPYRFTVTKEGFAPGVSEIRIPLGDATELAGFQAAAGDGGPGRRRRGRAEARSSRRRCSCRTRASSTRRRRVQGHPGDEPGRPRGAPEPRVDLLAEEGLPGGGGRVPEGPRAAAGLHRHRRGSRRRLPRERPARQGDGAHDEGRGRQPVRREGPVQQGHLPAEREPERGGGQGLRGGGGGRPDARRGVLPPRHADGRARTRSPRRSPTSRSTSA